MASSAIPKGSTILITGVNGLVASHCADQALALGFKVRGTVRSLAKVEGLAAVFEKKYGTGLFEAVVVESMDVEGAFDEVIQGCTAAIHCASIMTMSPVVNEVVPPTIQGALNIMKAATKTSSIKRVVYTSSQAALNITKPGVKEHFDQNSWNEEAVQMCKDPSKLDEQTSMLAAYCGSKTLAEKACFDFVKTEKPHFVFNSIVPNFNGGVILDPSQPASTSGLIKGAFYGDERSVGFFGFVGPQFYIDVQDNARLHLAAVIYEDVQNERLLGMAEPFNFNDILDIYAKIDPNRKFPDRLKDDPKVLATYDTARSLELLGRLGRKGWVSMEESIRANLQDVPSA